MPKEEVEVDAPTQKGAKKKKPRSLAPPGTLVGSIRGRPGSALGSTVSSSVPNAIPIPAIPAIGQYSMLYYAPIIIFNSTVNSIVPKF